MRLSRIHVEQPLQAGNEVTLDERSARYASQVLRLRAGETVILFNGDGRDFEAELTRCDRRVCRAQVHAMVGEEPAAVLQLHLGIGISRGERMDLAIQKSVELGVGEITPLLTARTVVQLPAERVALRLAHWRGVVASACEQCGRSRVPALHPPVALHDWLAGHPGGLVLDHRATQGLPDLAPPADSLNLLIGPEGGLDEAERAAAANHVYRPVRLGPRILRTETAPLAALAAIQVLWGDLR